MANVAVIGTQWGDEGKGKIVDLYTERADVVARFQGGNNAGHNLVVNGSPKKEYRSYFLNTKTGRVNCACLPFISTPTFSPI